jgi:hemerythrin
MPLIDWTDKMSVGVEEIDEQHKKLVGIINHLHDSLKTNSFKEELKIIFMELIDYTKYHFEAEEKIMEEAGYEDLESHKKQHQKFVNKLLRMKDRCYMGKEEISVELSSFLSSWMLGHILRSDKDYTEVVLNSDWYKNQNKSAA